MRARLRSAKGVATKVKIAHLGQCRFDSGVVSRPSEMYALEVFSVLPMPSGEKPRRLG